MKKLLLGLDRKKKIINICALEIREAKFIARGEIIIKNVNH